MPQSFPDMSSLEYAAKLHEFRTVNDGESEAVYREALADHVKQNGLLIESMEIRTGKGWDQFTYEENTQMIMSDPALKRFAEGLKLSAEAKAFLKDSPILQEFKKEGDAK